LRSSSSIETFFTAFRKLVPFNTQDRVLHNDIMQAIQFIQNWQ
jgi:histidine ammonia-lyase